MTCRLLDLPQPLSQPSCCSFPVAPAHFPIWLTSKPWPVRLSSSTCLSVVSWDETSSAHRHLVRLFPPRLAYWTSNSEMLEPPFRMSVTLRLPTPSLSQHPGWWPCSPLLFPFHTKHLAPNLGIRLGLLLVTCSSVLEEKQFEGRDFVLLMMLPRTQYLACSECSINICKTIHAMKPSENRTQSRPSGRTWPRVNFVKGHRRGRFVRLQKRCIDLATSMWFQESLEISQSKILICGKVPIVICRLRGKLSWGSSS